MQEQNQIQLEASVKTEILNLLRIQIEKCYEENKLYKLVENELIHRMETEELPNIILIKILELFKKSEDTQTATILGVLNRQNQITVNNTVSDATPEKQEPEFSRQEFQKAKKLLSFMDQLEKLK